MKNLLFLAVAGMFFSGCRTDVDFNNISVDGNARVNLSMPVGEISTSFADMIGLITDDADVTINEDSIIELGMKVHYENEFHDIDVANYIGKVEKDIMLQSVNPALSVLPANTEVDVPFDMEITFDGVNNDTSNERLDSLVIDLARFSTKITKSADLAISDNDIKKVEMQLGPMFRRAKGTNIEIPNFRLNSEIPIEVDNFTLNMMKDETQEPSNHNVLNTASIRFVITLKTGENVVVTAASGFHFSFKVEMMSYVALYGYFEPGSETRDSDEVKVPVTVGQGYKAILPVTEPEIKLKFTYALSMPLDVNFNFLKAIHPDGTESFAEWNGSTSTKKHLYTLVPNDAPIGTMVTDSSIIFNHLPENGHIDKFFEKEVLRMGYDYKLDIDKTRKDSRGKGMNQFRLTNQHKFKLDFEFKMPFTFNKGLDVSFGDTIRNVSLEKASLEELAKQSNGVIKSIEEADVILYLNIQNDIPVAVKLDAIFLDEYDNEITELSDKIKDVTIPAAKIVDGKPVDGERTLIPENGVGMKKDEFERLAATRSIYFRMKVGDELNPSVFYANKQLSIKMGIAANVKAAIDLGALF